MNVLEIFDEYTAAWFKSALGTPTRVQEQAWPAIAAGDHTLVTAPTGTGKTLTAFLVFIDRMKRQARRNELPKGVHLIYISPLKALAGDIRQNLRRPLSGIDEEERKDGQGAHTSGLDIEIAIRTGDTPQKDRQRMLKSPPHILITTPESLYLMLTSKKGKEMLKTAKWVIIDELHAMIDSKRGAHLMLSLARLDQLCEEPLQRIGLSATIEPASLAARYLSPDPVTVVKPNMHKDIKIVIAEPMAESGRVLKDGVWQRIASTVVDHSQHAKSMIVFVEGRMYAEKLAYYVNEIAGEGFARAHHGSLSKDQRFEVEDALRAGTLRVLCATSSMELGIDVGEIEQVLQVGCPRTISSTMQRLGRAGHSPNKTSVMYIFPKTASDGLYSGLTAQVAREGGVEYSSPPRQCLDVLAQHLVSMAVSDGYYVDDAVAVLGRAYPFREITKEDVQQVLRMLAGDYEHNRNIPVRPRIIYDRIHDFVEGDNYSRMLSVMTGGTIPDKGLYTAKTDSGVKLGELDEEFVFESRIGDTFLLGTFSWQIKSIQRDSVIVGPAKGVGGRLPFWKGEVKGRKLGTGLAFGRILREMESAKREGTSRQLLQELGYDEKVAVRTDELIERQMEATGSLPSDQVIIVEHCRDENENDQLMVHSVFGRQINAPLALLVMEAAKKAVSVELSSLDDDDGFLLYPYDKCVFPEGLLKQITPESARPILEALLPATPVFNMAFRYNAGRALMMGIRRSERQPLWLQRLKATDMLESLVHIPGHPLIRETRRECLEDYWDLNGLETVLTDIQAGRIQIHEVFIETPSPLSMPLRQQTEAAMMYNYYPTTSGIQAAVVQALDQQQMIAPAQEELTRMAERRKLPEDEKQLHTLLMIEGDLLSGELEINEDWFEILLEKEQALFVEPGLWIAAEQKEQYESALYDRKIDAMQSLVLRLLRYRGAQDSQYIAERYGWEEEIVLDVLAALQRQKNTIEYNGVYYHAQLFERAQKETVKGRRKQIETLPSQNYAAMLAWRIRIQAPPKEQLKRTLTLTAGDILPADTWEEIVLPGRVSSYREELLDGLLSAGEFVWRYHPGEGISFHLYDDIDWEFELETPQIQAEKDQILYEYLLKRGASFAQRLSSAIREASPYDPLMNLLEAGYVSADSFVPVRMIGKRKKLEQEAARRRVGARVKAVGNGRWELSYPLRQLTIEAQLERAFDRAVIVCRETVSADLWNQAYETLNMWEYTGRVRRGYFIEGLPGIQFIRDSEFNGVINTLENPPSEIIWIAASDPAQPWGKSLPHTENRNFSNLAGTLVALHQGLPVAVLERKGKTLRVFDYQHLHEAMSIFVKDYQKKHLYPKLKRLMIKQYDQAAADALISAGFMKEIQDYVLYRY